MARFSRVWHPRWTRVLIAGLFVASTAIGASFGLETRHQPATLAADTTAMLSRPSPTRLLDTHTKAPYFVIPQPLQYTPYGTPVTIPHLGVPAEIELAAPGGANKVVASCDLLDKSISRTVFITGDDGAPVAGATVVFTVTKSDVDEPQVVSDITGFDGGATITVKAPTVQAADKSFATYSVLAEAFDVNAATPAASARFSISDYTCTGAAGGR